MADGEQSVLNSGVAGSSTTGNQQAPGSEIGGISESTEQLERRRRDLQARADRADALLAAANARTATLEAEMASLRQSHAPAQPLQSATAPVAQLPSPGVSAEVVADIQQELAQLRAERALRVRAQQIDAVFARPENADIVHLRGVVPDEMMAASVPAWLEKLRASAPGVAQQQATVRAAVAAGFRPSATSVSQSPAPTTDGYVPPIPTIMGGYGGATIAGGASANAMPGVPTVEQINEELEQSIPSKVWEKAHQLISLVPLPGRQR